MIEVMNITGIMAMDTTLTLWVYLSAPLLISVALISLFR